MNSMTTDQLNKSKRRQWLYAFLYLLLIIISMIPPIASEPYAPQDTQDVIVNLLMVATQPYQRLGQVLHMGILFLIVLLSIQTRKSKFGGASGVPPRSHPQISELSVNVTLSNYKEKMGRIFAAFMGVNFIVIAFVQGMGHTEKYGFVVQPGSIIASVFLGVAWIVAAFRGTLKSSFEGVPTWRYFLFPLALLVYWAPYNDLIRPDFNPLLLFTSTDSALTFCFTTPVFLFLLILFYPCVDPLAYRLTAFNGLLYGLFNMTHFFNPGFEWMGVLHIPLLTLSFVALSLPRFGKRSV